MNTRAAPLVCATLFAAATLAAAQPAPVLRQLPAHSNVSAHLRDGSTIVGRLERQDADSLVIVGSMGRMAIPTVNIRDARDAGVAHTANDGSTEYWLPNANTTRLFFGPTGRTLAQGEAYFADHEVAIASGSVGITDRIQFGAGSLIVPNSNVWFVLPKVSLVRSEDFNLAAGVLFGGVDNYTGGIAYVVGTWGSVDNSVTAGVGQGLSGAKVSGKPVAMLGGETRISRRIALVTENYAFAGSSDVGLGYGMRFLGDRFSVDLAFMNSARQPVFPGIPYVDFVVKW